MIVPRPFILFFSLLFTWVPGVEAGEEYRPYRKDEPKQRSGTQLWSEPAYRQPVCMEWVDGRLLVVGCRKTGELLTVDVEQRRLVDGLVTGEGIDGLLYDRSRNLLVTWHRKDSQVRCWSRRGQQWISLATIDTPIDPRSVVWQQGANRLWVACGWSRQIACYAISQVGEQLSAEMVGITECEFSPGKLCFLQDSDRLLVADAFGGALGILDAEARCWVGRHDFLGQAIAQLQPTSDGRLLMLHGSLNPTSQTIQNDIHWGVLMANDLRWMEIDRLLSQQGENIYSGSRVHPVGVPTRGSGELTSFQTDKDGRIAVTIGGMDQVAIGSEEAYTFRYLPVGDYPLDCRFSPDGRSLWVLNAFSDSLTQIDLQQGAVLDELILSPQRALSEAEEGELHFHDAKLSHDGWMSCASCHVEGHGNGLLVDTLGDGHYGSPKRVLSLLVLRGTEHFGWTGKDVKLRDQIERSIASTMHRDSPVSPEVLDQLVAFCESLPAAPGVRAARRVAEGPEVVRGKMLFQQWGCDRCHQGTSYTSGQPERIDLEDERGNRLFSPPSLKGVSQRAPVFFHSGIHRTLAEVIGDTRHTGLERLEPEDVADLVAFLESL
ncbi:MAG: cytochrome c peroxidase [Pirellulaceae bacterium]